VSCAGPRGGGGGAAWPPAPSGAPPPRPPCRWVSGAWAWWSSFRAFGSKLPGGKCLTIIGTEGFARLLSADGCLRPLYDRVLLETHGCVVAPTLGSIIPYWLLVIPRAKCLNFRQWQADTGVNPHQVIADVLTSLGVAPERVIWFEHGSSANGHPVGCGVDHAHIHVIVDAPFSLDEFVSSASATSSARWLPCSPATAYASITPAVSYLVAGSASGAVFAECVDKVGSQFLRRIVADLAGQPDEWNYKIHPHIDNAKTTHLAFSGATALTTVG
jgi:ATP adenylyltransferase